ncbi:MAG: hypothetical protein PHQ28_09495 [Mycobacterium sp.]|nr:hypothetical protein [Mycobacterium sp.]
MLTRCPDSGVPVRSLVPHGDERRLVLGSAPRVYAGAPGAPDHRRDP